MDKSTEKINSVSTRISLSLVKEIKRAQNSLNDYEKSKPRGMKKKKWSYLETSHKLAKHLYNLRTRKIIDTNENEKSSELW